MKRVVIAFILLSIGTGAWAQTGQQFSLKQAQEYALTNNYDLINTKADLLSAEEQVKETRAIGLPQVNGSVDFQNFLKIPTTLIPAGALGDPNAPADAFIPVQFGTNYNTTASLSANQLIFDGSYIVGLRAIKEVRNLNLQNVERTELEVKDAVTNAYHTALVATENREVLEKVLVTMEDLLAETKAIFENGLAEAMDVDQMSLNVTNMRNSVNMAKRQEVVTKQLLKYQMGMDVDAAIELSDDLDALVNTTPTVGLLEKEFNASEHPDYKLLETQESLMVLSMQNERADYLPSLGAFFSHQQSNMGNDLALFDSDQWFPTTLWGLNLNVPIFSSGMRSSQVARAQIEVEKANTQLSQVENALKMQANVARSNYQSAMEVYQTEKDNLALAQRIQDRTLIKYQEGLASSFELSQAQSQYLSTEGNYVKSLLDLLSAKAALDKVYNNY